MPPARRRKVFEVKGVSGGHGAAAVLGDVSLNVAKGESVALLGPNGAGKSTLMAAITGTLARRSGAILLEGQDLVPMASHGIVEAGVALVPEGRQIFAPMSVRDNLRLGAMRLASRPGHSLEERYGYVFGLFPRLKERADQRGGTLSGGEQQMLAIGRALMSAPRLLLLDEPFLGLAPLIVVEIRRALAKLQESGLTILLVEQKFDIALAMTRRTYVMIKGRIALHEESAALAQRRDLANLYFALATAPR
ncbi:MAG: ABC transporter ATP-binding protein [Rhodospirillaceae bacterium]|nr:ABC transporter ATP-binding protein [Rhodospirillaceae bacterium]